MAKRAVISVSMEMIHHLLQLPDDIEVLHATIGSYGLTLDLIVTAPNMADLDPMAMPPRADVAWTQEDGVVRIQSVSYPSDGLLLAAADAAGGAE